MIPSKTIKNVQVSAPILSLLIDAPYLEHVPLRALYPQWSGESIQEIREKHTDNPYRVRIGTPTTDKQMQQERVFFIQSYLSYNPINKQLEKRELVPYRNIEKVFIGEQTTDEAFYRDATLFINGPMVAKDLILLQSGDSLAQTIEYLLNEVKFLRSELAKLHNQSKTDLFISNELIK